MGRLNGKIALITGGARGIGLAFAERYISEGAKVALADINAGEAEKSAARIGNGTIAVKLDVTDQKSIDECVNKVIEQFGHIDILVNCAAVIDLGTIVEITPDSYKKMFDTNVYGTLFMMQAVARRMIARGKGGKIINIASQAGRRGDALYPVYCATKAAVISLTQSAGLDLAKHGINVNGIGPGYVDTEMWRSVVAKCAKYDPQKTPQMVKSLPLGRISKPAELAGMAVFLASDDANYVVAQTYNVDGGCALN